MERRRPQRIAIWLVATVMLAAVAVGEADRENKSSLGGLYWSTAKEEVDLMRKAGSDEDSAVGAVKDLDEYDGGFSTLDGMLQWAIGHSDSEKLKETAQDVQRLSPDELKKRQTEIKKLKMPSDTQLMQIALDDLNNPSISLEDRHRALQELLILVEPLDNANDLNKLGGLVVVVRELNHPDPDIRKISAWILGTAIQNNPVVQKQVLELGALTKLMKMMNSSFVEEAIKALYAVSALIRNNIAGQEMFFAEAGDLMLLDILHNSSIDVRLCKKVLSLVGDLIEYQVETRDKAVQPFFSNRIFLKSLVDLTASTDLDLQEKALVVIKNLLELRTTEAWFFKDFCDLDGALMRMRLQLDGLKIQENLRDFVTDVESLREEVELIFHQKLGKVPT